MVLSPKVVVKRTVSVDSYNQTARREPPEMLPGCSRVAGLLFGARFFSDRDVEGLFGHVDHRVIRLGT